MRQLCRKSFLERIRKASLRTGGKKNNIAAGGVPAACTGPMTPPPTRTAGKILKLLESSSSPVSPQSMERRHTIGERPLTSTLSALQHQALSSSRTHYYGVEDHGTAILQGNHILPLDSELEISSTAWW